MINIEYNLWIVFLSFIIAILSSYSALNLAGKIYQESGKAKVTWLFAGAFVMGTGVWSMHFIGMMAMGTNMPMNYNIPLTILSALASIFASLIAFLISSKETIRKWNTFLGGIIMGSGIIAMHYIGMSAVITNVKLNYNLALLLASVIIAYAASYAALYLIKKFRNNTLHSHLKLYSAIIMAIAVCGMHYTGMAAANFQMDNHAKHIAIPGTTTGDHRTLLIAVTIGTLIIIIVTWSAFFFENHILERMAYTDSLTSLANRNGLNKYFKKRLDSGSVFFIDLDRFKVINDTLGHDIGDKLLIEISNRLRVNRKAFRIGGDEFLIVAKNITTIEKATDFANTILDEIRKPFYIDENELYVTGSIGISFAPEHGTQRNELVSAADAAMYQAKKSNEGNIDIYSNDLGIKHQRRLVLEKDLRKGLVHQEFFIVYQPKYDFSTGKLVGMEALLRWQHPELGLVPPIEFIPIAEETGVIIPMTEWMLTKVCQQNQDWQAQHLVDNLVISINMSARIFESQRLQGSIEQALNQTGLNPHLLELEITESIAMNNINNTIEQLKELRAMGIKVSLDDFGTGYSSLGSLDEMPIDIIKIDQSFIRSSNIPTKQAIINSIILIAKNLNMGVIAEGVEEINHIEFLKKAGCSVMQGYYISKPLDTEDMNKWLRDQQKIS
ncbi:bifunctional diguanylate cyclase/phosphodiesterase [Aquibacillus kalidii]|uniref:bifunctional diguanylate cyclase/phosphodiesterase n=1 Tax=Aquibacillus kalidii TaxID=2762597 RepID=UPI00164625C3|nr:EAL domain-containing protein [Aquibacillus kalidii]